MEPAIPVEKYRAQDTALTLHSSSIWQNRAAWMQRILVALAFLFLVNEIQTENTFFLGSPGKEGIRNSKKVDGTITPSGRGAFPRIHMILRAYSGDRARLMNMFMPSFEAFFLFSQASFTLVLDAESPTDELLASDFLDRVEPLFTDTTPQASLRTATSKRQESITRGYRTIHANITASQSHHTQYSVRIVFVDPPNDAVLVASPFKEMAPHRYASKGYARQLYDTFWFDIFTPLEADLEKDIVSIIDADAPFVTVAALENTLVFPFEDDAPNRGEGSSSERPSRPIRGSKGRLKVRVPVAEPPAYLGGDQWFREPTKYGIMSVNSFPQVFQISTFKKLRKHIGTLWKDEEMPSSISSAIAAAVKSTNSNTEQDTERMSFDQAWLKCFGKPISPIAFENQKMHLSPADALFHYGLTYQPEFYFPVKKDATEATPVFASNGGRREYTIMGCCRSFNFDWCSFETLQDFVHMTERQDAFWPYGARKSAGDSTYDQIHKALEEERTYAPQMHERMEAKCRDVETWVRW